MKRILFISALSALCPIAHAALSTNLVAYYNFEQTGTAGIANQVGASYSGAYFDTSTVGTGAGFAGSVAFAGNNATTTTNRSTLLVGKALNIDSNPASGAFNVSTIGTAVLGQNFSISSWFYMAPDADNTAKRPYAFESGTPDYDISYGASGNVSSSSTTGTFLPYVGQVAAPVSQSLTVGAWHNVVNTFSSNGTTTTMQVYLDGVSVTSQTATTSSMSFSGIHFGYYRGNDASRTLDGMMDEVAVWDRALTSTEINNANVGLAADSVYQRGLAGLAVIPEPSTALLGSLGVLALLRRRRSC